MAENINRLTSAEIISEILDAKCIAENILKKFDEIGAVGANIFFGSVRFVVETKTRFQITVNYCFTDGTKLEYTLNRPESITIDTFYNEFQSLGFAATIKNDMIHVKKNNSPNTSLDIDHKEFIKSHIISEFEKSKSPDMVIELQTRGDYLTILTKNGFRMTKHVTVLTFDDNEVILPSPENISIKEISDELRMNGYFIPFVGKISLKVYKNTTPPPPKKSLTQRECWEILSYIRNYDKSVDGFLKDYSLSPAEVWTFMMDAISHDNCRVVMYLNEEYPMSFNEIDRFLFHSEKLGAKVTSMYLETILSRILKKESNSSSTSTIMNTKDVLELLNLIKTYNTTEFEKKYKTLDISPKIYHIFVVESIKCGIISILKFLNSTRPLCIDDIEKYILIANDHNTPAAVVFFNDLKRNISKQSIESTKPIIHTNNPKKPFSQNNLKRLLDNIAAGLIPNFKFLFREFDISRTEFWEIVDAAVKTDNIKCVKLLAENKMFDWGKFLDIISNTKNGEYEIVKAYFAENGFVF